MNPFEPEFFVPFMIFAIPILAVLGGFTTGILRMMGRQRLIELAQQERIAAIQRGIDPAQLAPIQTDLLDEAGGYPAGEHARRLHRNLLVGGVVTMFVGIGISSFLRILRPDGSEYVWAVGLIPGMTGLGMLIASMLVRP